MTSGRNDDNPLAWAGDDDPTLVRPDTVGSPHVSPTPESVPAEADPGAESVPVPDAEPASEVTPETDVAPDSDAAPVPDAASLQGDATATTTTTTVSAATSNAALITLGVLAGGYLLYTIGWIIGGLRFQETDTVRFLVSPVGYQASLWLAILAAPIWFISALVVTRRSRRWVRILWLIIGLVLLIPWPFVMIGAVGQ